MSAATKTPAPAIPRENTIHGTRLLIWRNILSDEPTARLLWATIFPAGWDWDETYTTASLYDWKWDKDAGTIYIRGELRRSSGSSQGINGTFPAQMEEATLKAPGRNFQWNPHGYQGREWRNIKTGETRGAQ